MSLPLFLIPMLVGLLAQSLKPLLNRRWYAQLEATNKRVPRYGGMPSAHTAFATSLATVVAWADGFSGPTFAIAATLVIYVLDDALRMRAFLSRHGLALRLLVERIPAAERTQFPYLETRLGHKGTEVLVGGLIGILVSLLLLYFLTLFSPLPT